METVVYIFKDQALVRDTLGIMILVLILLPASCSLYIWYVRKERHSEILLWLYHLRVCGALVAVLNGGLGFINEDFTRRADGGQDRTRWLLTGLFIAGLAARKWGKTGDTEASGAQNGQTVRSYRSYSSAAPYVFIPIASVVVFLVMEGILTEYKRHSSWEQAQTEVRKSLPKQVNDFTLLEDIQFERRQRWNSFLWIDLDPLRTTYRFKLNVVPKEVSELPKLIRARVCSNEKEARSISLGDVNVYTYYDKNGLLVASFTIDKCP